MNENIKFRKEGSFEWLPGKLIRMSLDKQPDDYNQTAKSIEDIVRDACRSVTYTVSAQEKSTLTIPVWKAVWRGVRGLGYGRSIEVVEEKTYETKHVQFQGAQYSQLSGDVEQAMSDPEAWVTRDGRIESRRGERSPLMACLIKLREEGVISRDLTPEEIGILKCAARGMRLAEKPKTKNQVITEYLKRVEDNKPIIDSLNRTWWEKHRPEEPYPLYAVYQAPAKPRTEEQPPETPPSC